MQKLWGVIVAFFQKASKTALFLSLIAGFIVTWFMRQAVTAFLLPGKLFSARSLLYKSVYYLSFSLLLGLLVFLVLTLLQKKLSISQFFQKYDQKLSDFAKRFQNNPSNRALFVLILLGISTIFTFLDTSVFTSLDLVNWTFRTTTLFPPMNPIGADFRAGFYDPARALFIGKNLTEIWSNAVNTNAYPPLVTLVGLFFQPFEENTAYVIQVFLLFTANIACLGLTIALIKRYIFSTLKLTKELVNVVSWSLFFALSFMLFASYPFIFSIERGNYDIFALLFSLLALWSMLTQPKKMWLQVIFLSIATQLKIYPALLFLLLLKKHGAKMLLPTAVVNILLFFILGPYNAAAFIQKLAAISGQSNPYLWIGNHSSMSFVSGLLQNAYPQWFPDLATFWMVFTLAPVLIWAAVAVFFLIRPYSERMALFVFMISIPVMDVLPTVSHDYKLVILFADIALFLAFTLRNITEKPAFSHFIQLLGTFVVLLAISKSYVFYGPAQYYLLANKYLYILLLEVLMLWSFLSNRHFDLPEPIRAQEIHQANS